MSTWYWLSWTLLTIYSTLFVFLVCMLREPNLCVRFSDVSWSPLACTCICLTSLNIICPLCDTNCLRFLNIFQLIPMTDIQDVMSDFQKLNKAENCIVLQMKNDAKLAITSQVMQQGSLLSILHYITIKWLEKG